MQRGPVAEISLSALSHNFKTLRTAVQNRPVIAVVKADAYGHGSIEVSKRLLKEGASYLAVAFTSEAAVLRNAGISSPIIVLFDRDDIRDFFDLQLIPVVYSIDTALALSQEAKKRKTVIKIHVKIDTGMGRLGLRDREIKTVSDIPGLVIEGILSHFSEADLQDRSFADQQIEKFRKTREYLEKILKRKILSHMANSSAVLSCKDAYFDLVRPGIALYGYSAIQPFIENQKDERRNKRQRSRKEGLPDSGLMALGSALMPVMSVKTKILSLRNLPPDTPVSYGRTFVTKRNSRIGVIPLGYADGFSRLFSNNAEVLVRGRRVPVVGRVCMDLTMIDVTEAKGVKEGDEVVIIGAQGKESVTAVELSKRINTIPYEILTSLGSRSRRVYV